MENINRGGQNHAVRVQEFVRDTAMVVIDPSFAFLHAEGAAGAITDFVVGKVDDFQLKSFPGEERTEHFDQKGCVSYPLMG